MHKYDVKNRNGSLIFVRGVKVKPYANFSTNLDPITARELAKFGVSLTRLSPVAVPDEDVMELPVETEALVEDSIISEQNPESVVEAVPVVEETAPEAPVAQEEAPVVEETAPEAPVAQEEAPVVEETPAAPEPIAEAPAAEPAAEIVAEPVVEPAPEAAVETPVEAAPEAVEPAVEEAPASDETAAPADSSDAPVDAAPGESSNRKKKKNR
jgi:hypothetical protein